MSTDVQVVIGKGIRLPYDDIDYETIDADGYADYEENKVCFITDVMNGNWAYLIKPYKIIDCIYESCHGEFDDFITEQDYEEFKKAYQLVYPDKELDLSLIKSVYFNWYS